MLQKLFGSRNHNVNTNPTFTESVVEKPLIVKIIHAGGFVERYYMALPAALIIEKYPKFVLARPDIFQRPWDSIVRPDEMLVPGQKYFVVPTLTVKKLRQRMVKPRAVRSVSLNKDKPEQAKQTKQANRRVRFKGIETKTRRDAGGDEEKVKKSKKKGASGRGLRRKNVSFSPMLTVIDGRG
ncbi:hypothetical protein HanXRQr2_Chr10g0451901 [Helianthus annuus]|uniref:Uncharacterized protein n=1 Tax=Helianthus annuus TaxID=4232 RepID=A0A9K3HZW3_HELAN|nr:hypothetical protein HanXRQr2_Chr10g0451901 [Helianthus annuus]